MKVKHAVGAALLLLTLVFAAGCGRGGDKAEPPVMLAGDPVIVGSLQHMTNVIMAHVAMHALESHDIPVEANLGISGTANIRAAMLNGEVDFLWGYTSSMYNLTGGNFVPDDTPQNLHTRLAEADAPLGLTWLTLTPATIVNSFTMTRENSERLGITSLSGAAEYLRNGGSLVLASTPAFFQRHVEGFSGMVEAYAMEFDTGNTMPMVTDMVIPALESGIVDLGHAAVTDWRMMGDELVQLDDDRGFFAVASIAPCVSADALTRFPQIPGIINPIAERVTVDVLRNINFMIYNEGMEPGEAALAWLRTEGFID